MYKYLCEGGGGVTQIFFVFQDLKIVRHFLTYKFFICVLYAVCVHSVFTHCRRTVLGSISVKRSQLLTNVSRGDIANA